jgi:hypothetical protein
MKRRIMLGTMLAVTVAAEAGAQTFTMTYGEPGMEQFVAPPAMVGSQTIVEARETPGRPYSADATTEFLQVLADGNRISHKTTTRIFRDSEGRTRREELSGNDTPQSVSIYDPVAQASYILDPRTRTAFKMAVSIMYPASGAKVMARGTRVSQDKVGETFTVVVSPEASHREAGESAALKSKPAAVTTFKGAAGSGGFGFVMSSPMKMSGTATSDSLGQEMIAGVPATGTRTTTVIPAGKIGNQLEIKIVSEQWFSEDLQVLVMTKHSDPRSGETTYRLSNISRAEPGAGLFEVPPDYTVKDRGKPHEQQ